MSTLTNSKYAKAYSVQEAIALAQANPGFSFLAGGTDVMVNIQQGTLDTSMLIDISAIAELKTIRLDNDELVIGGMATLYQVASDSLVSAHLPTLRQAALSIATPTIRQSATIGGNLLCENRCSFYNQSEWWREAVGYCLKCDGDICIATGGKKNCFSRFVSDTAPVLIAQQATVTLSDGQSLQTLPIESLYSGDGVISLKKKKEHILVDIRIPVKKTLHTVFRKLRPRKTLDFTSLTTAVALTSENEWRIVIGGVDPQPVLLIFNATDDTEEIVNKCMKKPRIVDNDFYSRKYRKDIIGHFVLESLTELLTYK